MGIRVFPQETGYLVGEIRLYSSTSVPSGWLACDGSAISRTTYAALFAVCGTSFGVGDGSTTFNVPDLRGRAPIGAGTGSGLTARSLGATVGTETHALSEAEGPTHSHSLTIIEGAAGHGHTISSNGVAAEPDPAGATDTIGTATSGSGTAHQNMQPSLAVQLIIRY